MKQYKITENNITYEIIELIGNKFYYLNKLLHREYGPAVEYDNGEKHWYKNGKRHRENGPACEYASGDKIWCKNGKWHREDGPAVEWVNGRKEYWYNDKQIKNIYSNQEFIRYVKLLSIS